MSTEYHSAQEDFNILISKLPPWVMSNFVIWLDLKVAEYKIFGRILSESEKYEAKEFFTGHSTKSADSHASQESTPRQNTSIHHQHQQRNEVGPFPEILVKVQPRNTTTNRPPKRKRPDKASYLSKRGIQQTSIDKGSASSQSQESCLPELGLRIIDSSGNPLDGDLCNKQTAECVNLDTDENTNDSEPVDSEPVDTKPEEGLLMEVSNESEIEQRETLSETQSSGLVSVIKLELPDNDVYQVLPTMQQSNESEMNIQSSSSWQPPSTSNEESLTTDASVAAEIEKSLQAGQEKSSPNKLIKNVIDLNPSVAQHGVYNCNLCNNGNKCFQTEVDAVHHLIRNHGIDSSYKQSEYISKVFECRFRCGSVFRHINQINKHEKRVHMSKGIFCCSFCSKTFGSKYVLDAHIRNHTGEKLKCATCEKTFLYPHSLKEHERCCEFGPGANQIFPCELCTKGQVNSSSSLNKGRKFLFKSKKYLRQHMRMVHHNY